jgi:glucosamine-6-phosphate deaminase
MFDEAIREAGGVDLQLLGIGTNGHVGFNEPASSFASRTRVTALTASTRESNSRFFESVQQVPTHCITQGLGTILEARRLVLVADGTRKAEAVARAVEGPVTSMCPASAVQLHPRATIVIDELAAAKLALRDYYRYAGEHPARTETGALR